MFDQQSRAKEYLHLILNIAICSLFATLEQLLCNSQGTIIWELVFIPCGIIFALIYITQYFHWNKGDLSSFFFWALIIKRIFLLGMNEGEFVYFLFGLLNGIYTNKLYINDSKKFYLKSKTIIQVIVILSLTIINLVNETREDKIVLIVIFTIVSIILGLNDNIELQDQTKKQDDYQTDLKHNQFELKKCQTTIVQIQQQQQQQLQVQYQQKSNWEQYQQQTDEWICKMDVNKYSLTESVNQSEQNYAMKKSLGDYKISLTQLFQNLMITSQSTNLQQSITLWSEIVETNSLLTWLEKNFFSESSAAKLEQARQKQQYKCGIDAIQGIQDDQISIISPQNEAKCTINKDQVYELSAQQHGDMQGSNSVLSNKTTLGCYFINNQTRLEMSVSIYLMEDEFDGKKTILILVIRNIEKETKKLKFNLEKIELQKVIFYKYILRVADEVSQILKSIVQIKKQLDQRQKEFDKIKQNNFISLSFCDGDAFIKSEKMIGDMKLSQHLSVPMQPVVQNSNQRVTSSLTQNPDSQEEQLQKLYTISQPTELIKQIDKWFNNVVLIENNNFNFFEVFSLSEYKANRFNFIKSLNIVKDLFKFDSCIQKYNITISQDIHNENEMELTTDKRKVKQVLINLIKNSIQCFDYNFQKGQDEKLNAMQIEQKQDIKSQDLKIQNTIMIKAWADEDKINVEIIDNGGGINQEMIKNRLQDCKLGLKACSKILRNLSYDPRKPLQITNYMKSKDGIKGTVVQFTLSKQNIPTQCSEENIYSDSIIIINKVELN